MNKIGIYRIGFKEQNEVNDVWVEQEQQERGIPVITIDGVRRFKSIDQKNTTLTEELIDDENGIRYEVQLPFVVRKEEDVELADKYSGRPVVMYVWAVDGHLYKIGSKLYPAYMITSNKYQGLDTREMAVNVYYESLTKLLK